MHQTLLPLFIFMFLIFLFPHQILVSIKLMFNIDDLINDFHYWVRMLCYVNHHFIVLLEKFVVKIGGVIIEFLFKEQVLNFVVKRKVD